MATVSYLTGSTNETYSDEAFRLIGGIQKDYILQVSAALGVSAGAIAGAMAEENSAYDGLDRALDFYARTNLSEELLRSYIEALDQGDEAIQAWFAAHADELSERTHEQWKADYEAVAAVVAKGGLREFTSWDTIGSKTA